MLVVLVLLVGLAFVAGAVLALVLAFWLVALAVVAVGLLALVRGVTGRWPSARAVTLGAGLTATLGLWVLSGESKWVLIGGVVGTLVAGRAAALDDLDL